MKTISSKSLPLAGLLVLSSLVILGSAEDPPSVVLVTPPMSLHDVPVKEEAVYASEAAGTPLKCYQCNSYLNNTGTPCSADAPEKRFIAPCEPKEGKPAIGCWNMVQWVDYDQNKTDGLVRFERTIRQCAYVEGAELGCIKRSGFGGKVMNCFCNVTECNSARGVGGGGATSPLILLSTALVTVLAAAFKNSWSMLD